MIQKFVDRFIDSEDQIKRQCEEGFDHYEHLVKFVVGIISDPEEYSSPDVNRITEIDHGDYQGTLLYIIAAKGYQPHQFWAVKVDYGSCSGCDALESAMYDYKGKDRVDAHYNLCLHIVQGIKEVA